MFKSVLSPAGATKLDAIDSDPASPPLRFESKFKNEKNLVTWLSCWPQPRTQAAIPLAHFLLFTFLLFDRLIPSLFL
jgi:hypothetical protein